MNSGAVPFLYLPVFYWGAFVLLLYRHDLSRLTHSFRDRGGLRNWWPVLLSLGLLNPEQARLRPGGRKQVLPYVVYLLVAAGLSLSWIIPMFPRGWYYLVAVQASSGLVLAVATVMLLGTPPRRPYVDVLRYPRLGSRIRHLHASPMVAQAGQARPSPKASVKVRFFNVSLKNGTIVSTPSYPEKQAFCANLVHALETSNPDFAWIQFLFVKSKHGSALVGLKNSLQRAKEEIERPSLDLLSGQERNRRELRRDFYRQADSRMKKVDDMVTKPMVTLAIQGMWVSSKESSSIDALPFDHCSDEHDSLAVFQYREPRMLRELVDRRMVEDIGEYLDRYTKSRLEPPSFMVTPEGLQSYVHLPAGETVGSLRSIKWGTSARGYNRAKVDGKGPKEELDASGLRVDISSRFVRLATVPKMEKILEDSSVQPLDHLSSAIVRTFECVYRNGETELVLSAGTVEDMKKYVHLLESVYGGLNFEKTGQFPAFLRELPSGLDLGGS